MPNDPLARYHFTDDHGHPLENCVEYRELLAEFERLRGEVTRLNKEADWLAGICTMGYCADHDLSPVCHQEKRDCRECIRKTACKAVKETKNG